MWTFHDRRGHMAAQGMRFFVVSLVVARREPARAPSADHVRSGKLVAQAIAIVVVTPLNFIGNKLWSFRLRS